MQMACSQTCPAAQSAPVLQPTLTGDEDGAGAGADETKGEEAGADEGAALGALEGAADDGALEGNELWALARPARRIRVDANVNCISTSFN